MCREKLQAVVAKEEVVGDGCGRWKERSVER